MEWPESIDLDKMKLHAAPYGGPIAITKNPKQIPKSGIVKPVISIFTSSGVLISTINVSSNNTENEALLDVCLNFSGTQEHY